MSVEAAALAALPHDRGVEDGERKTGRRHVGGFDLPSRVSAPV